MPYSDVHNYISGYWKEIIRKSPQELDRDTLLPLPHPFLIPSSRIMFQEMYYWDSFFMALGLVGTQYEEMIVGIAENMAHLLQKYGVIPNASRGHFLSRSQPPLFTKLIWLAYEVKRRRGDNDTAQFLSKMMRLAEFEHDVVWMGEAQPHFRLVHKEDGLSRSFDTNFLHDLACCESGWDHSPRCNDRWLDHLPVDLNSILFAREMDFAQSDRILGHPWRSEMWQRRANERAERMNELMWDDNIGFYFDVDFNHTAWVKDYNDDHCDVEIGSIKYRRSLVPSLAGFYPMWAKLAREDQASRMVKDWLPKFEQCGGLATTTECDAKGNKLQIMSKQGERYQWMYPNGWAPLQWIVVKGLERYGYFTEATRIRKKWCDTCATVFRISDSLWEKYNIVQIGHPPAKGGYDEETGTDSGEIDSRRFGNVAGFGWTNAVFVDFEQRLHPSTLDGL